MLIDGRKTDKFLNDTFNAGVDNFNRRISEFESNLSYQYLADLYDAFYDPQNWRSKPNDLQAYLMSYVHSIKYDYAKALQHLLQGYLSDHYFFIRRAVESVQLILFLKEKINTEQIFQEYSEISTNDFKNRHKFEKVVCPKEGSLPN